MGVRSPVIETRITALIFHLWHCVRATSSGFVAKIRVEIRASARKRFQGIAKVLRTVNPAVSGGAQAAL